MNRNVFLLLILTAFIFGCAQQKHLTMAMSEIQNCVQAEPKGNCPGGADRRNKITIHLINGVPKVTPQNVCASEDSKIEIKITPPNTDIDVFVIPEDTKNGWILANNSENSAEMTISVPKYVEKTDYKYLVLTSNGHCIDPRIYVD